MLTRSEVHEAEAEANSHEAETIIALFFQPNFTFDPIFSKQKEKFLVDFRLDFKNFGSNWALA